MSEPGEVVPAAAAPEPTKWTARHPAATYTLARLGLFVIFLVPLLLVTRNLFISLITAAIASSVISIFALRRQRDALSTAIATRGDRAKQAMADRAASEDEWDDAQRAASESGTESGNGTGDAGSARD